MTTAPARTVAPYESFARIYDAVTGDALFPKIWQAFRQASQRHRIRFRSAADLGCGTGAFLACIARPDRRLYGVDRSPAMLAIARERLAGCRITLLRQDLHSLSLPQPVDLMTCNGATLNYTTSLTRLNLILQRIAENTSFGGWLIFDIILNVGKVGGNRHLTQTIRLPGTRARWSIRVDPSGRGSVVDMTTQLRRADGNWEVSHEAHRQRWFRIEEIASLLQNHRWKLLGMTRLDDRKGFGDTGGWQQVVVKRQ